MAARQRTARGRTRGLLRQFHRNTRGNAIMIMGFALVPITGMIGSAVDLSRAYLAKTRMQQACDAGALAGRRVLTANVFNDAVRNEATRFFNFNYRQGENSSSAVTPTVTMPTNGVIHVTASGTVPTMVMQLFGITSLPISVQCDASQDFVNTDIVLVLDSTGSMTCTPADPPTCSSASEKAGSKMQGLRDAVMAFYDALKPVQDQLEANGLRLRYSVVPYSQTVNVGREIMQASPSYMVSDTMTVQSRYANSPSDVSWFQISQTTTNYSPTIPGVPSYPNVTQDQCSSGPDTLGLRPRYEVIGTPTYTASGVTTTQLLGKVKVQTDRKINTTWTPNSPGSSTGTCAGRLDNVTTTWWRRSNWTYGAHDLDVSQYVQGNAMEDQTWDDSGGNGQNPDDTKPGSTGQLNPNRQVTWNGCIEERQTVNSINTGSSITPPSGAYDLDVDMIPTSDKATKWKPMLPSGMWYPANSVYSGFPAFTSEAGGTAACPAESSRLKAWTRAAMLSYVNALVAGGSTYHDVGMMWGARMLSPKGIFASDNPTTYNNMPVQRFVIFMTDGYMEPNGAVYNAYGVERINSPTRVTPSYSGDPDLKTRHIRRFNIACQQTKNLTDANGNRAIAGIWAISFGAGSTVDSNLSSCASSPDQAKQASDTPALIAAFQAIGNKIGSLRLTR